MSIFCVFANPAQSTRLLLTLSNMSHFQSEITPHLLSLFETLFSVQLTDETSRIRDVLSQLDTQLFKSYTKPHALQIQAWVEAGIFSASWAAGAGQRGKRGGPGPQSVRVDGAVASRDGPQRDEHYHPQ